MFRQAQFDAASRRFVLRLVSEQGNMLFFCHPLGFVMDTQSLTQLVIATLEDNKGQSIVELDITGQSDLVDRMVVVSATSNRHAKSLAEKVWVATKQAGMRPLGQEGNDESGWILLDLDHIIVHVMLPDVRDYYEIEELWCAKPETPPHAD